MTSYNWGEIVEEAAASNRSFDPVPEGDYDLKVLESPYSVSQNTGSDMWKIKAEIVTPGPHKGRLIWDNLVLQPNNGGSAGFFFRKVAAFGLGREWFIANKPSSEQIATIFPGRTFRAKLGIRTYNGKKSNEVKEYYPATVVAAAAAPGASAPVPPPVSAPAPAPVAAAPAPAPQFVTPAAPAFPGQVVPVEAAPAASPWETAPAGGVTPPPPSPF